MQPAPTPTNETVLEPLLHSLIGEDAVFAMNPGNAGDALIAAGTLQLFDRLGLKPETVDPRRVTPSRLRNRVVIYGGGGSLVARSRGRVSRHFLRAVHRDAAQVIVLPHTMTGNTDLLAELGDNVTLFCREVVSCRHAASAVTRAHVFPAHDMAFYLDVSPYLAEPSDDPLLTVVRDRVRRWSAAWRSGDNATLRCFRTDKERPGGRLPRGNLDLPRLLKPVPLNGETVHTMTRRLLRFLNHYDTVHTNRLHVAIGTALLGKAVHLYPNNYFKNRAVYECSIKAMFPQVIWRNGGTEA